MFNCQDVKLPELKENVVETPVSIQGTATDPWNGKTYQDLQTNMNYKLSFMENAGKSCIF